MRRKTVFIGVFYICGLFIASFLSVSLCCIAMIVAAAAGFILSFRFDPKHCLAASAAFVFAVGLYLVYTVINYNAAVAYDGSEVVFTGKVRDITYAGSDMYSFTLRGKLGGVTTDISFYAVGINADYSDTVTVRATVTKPSDSLAYQAEKYSKPKGEFLNGGYAQVISIESGGFSLRREIMHYRDYLFSVITEALPGEEGGFIAAMLCGDKSELDYMTRQSLYRTGIGHIFSVSGMHLIIVSFAGINLLRKLRTDYRIKFLLGEAIMMMFVVFAGASVSVTRAAIMMTILNTSVLMRRKYDCFSSVVISVIILTIGNPYAIRSASLLLSAGGAFALGVAAPAAVKLVRPKGRFARLKESFIYMSSVSVLLLPINLMFFDEISIVAPITNTLLVPLFTLSLTLAAAVMFTGGISFIAAPLLTLAGIPTKLLLVISDLIAGLPFAAAPTGYKSVRISAMICWVAAFAVILTAGKRSGITIAAAAVSFVCFISACITNYVMLSDTLRIYSVSDKTSQMLVIGKSDQCIIVNLSGGGRLSAAVKRICDSKGFTSVAAYYDIADSTTALANVMSRIGLGDCLINESYSGFADIEYCGDRLTVNGGSYTVTNSGVFSTQNGQSLSLDGEAQVIYIRSDGNISIKELNYTLVE